MRLSTAKLMQKFRNWGHTFSRLWLNCKPLGVTWHIQNLTFQALKSRFGSEVENLHNVLLWKYILVTALNIKNVRSNICPRNSTCLLFAVNMNYKRPYINSFKMATVLGVLIVWNLMIRSCRLVTNIHTMTVPIAGSHDIVYKVNY